MESFPRFNREHLDAKEKIRSLKKPFVEIFRKLEEKILETGFDGIVSDDTGARIPTLIFREVYKKITAEHPVTVFVATGQSYYPKTEAEKESLQDYLKVGLKDSEYIALVTQYIHSGDTVARLVDQLHQLGYKVSVVALDALTRNGLIDAGMDLTASRSFSDAQHSMAERHMLVSDITKRKSYSPVPMRLDTAIETGEIKKSDIVYREEYNEFTGFKPEAFPSSKEVTDFMDVHHDSIAALDKEPLSPEEKQTIQQNINYTRGLCIEVADEIVAELHEQGLYSMKN